MSGEAAAKQRVRTQTAWAYVYNVLSNVLNDTDMAEEAAGMGLDPRSFLDAVSEVMDEMHRKGRL